ncbi:3-oxoacyl-[acyl-carrier-protein] synthase III C-terminal domain-containing protein [Actinophytocola algeriensis]|uniref:3-oxoacyl-[acyl-carrier-protein] synthase-3 n=1 Tax=Actinophytocola algeriensis TaxID=1768010 RepID=A0A7W7VJC8_9PSEU|nr:3-oxoacyl-[acyl-carrier-protein] synthase III C-terminal domain-containing protein [Actinophytocola algeriensis]MBB4912209.1 3-oxoacyl-[acyl-carrier-protein] synthase-3 [Actinophytocola algeriensis]MBE1474275.1 3-oxoacyl-[acyl-carrier-protein] synthase-3 [Actinophytocola algeriensis]
MTTLADVAAFLPERVVPVEEMGPELGLTPTQVRVLRRFNGLGEVRRQRPGETLVDLLEAAARALPSLRGREHLVRYVIHARGVPVVAPYPVNPVHELRQRLGLTSATAFTVTHHACVSGLLAIDIAGRLSARHPDPGALVLVVAGEQVFTMDARLTPDHRVFGEGAGACLVSAGGPGDAVLSFACGQRSDLDHYSEEGAAGAAGAAGMDRFAQEYTELLAEVILAAVKQADLSLDDLALVLPHNVNVVSWRRVCRRIGLPVDRVLLDNVPLVGHTPSADTFINHASAVALGRLTPGDRYLTAGAGFGAVFSAMVLEHRAAGHPAATQHGSGNMAAIEVTDLRGRVVDTLGVLLGRLLGADLVVSEETRLFDELGLSSSKTLELLLALEDELDLQVDIEDIDRRDLVSVGSLSDFVVANVDGA